MNAKTNNQKSPFAKKTYGGTKHGNAITYNPQGEFKKVLKEFIHDNFGADVSVSDAMDQMVKDYFFRYAYKTKGYYGKTLVCALSKSDIHFGLEDDVFEPIDYERFKYFNLRVSDIGILDRYVKSNYGGDDFIYLDDEMIDNYAIIGALAYDKPFNDLDPTMKDYVENKDNFYGDDDCIVLECALNNSLDANFNGIYCYENTDGTPNKNLHVGVNIVNLNSNSIDYHVDAFPIIYYWYLDQDFNVKIKEIFKIPNDDFEKLINKYAYNDIGVIGKLNKLISIGTGYEIRLKEELKHKRELEQKLWDSEQRIKRLQKSIEMHNKVND